MATAAPMERLDLGRVVVRATGAIGRNLLLLALLALILQFVPALVIQALVPSGAAVSGALPVFGVATVIASLISFVLYFAMQAAVTHAIVRDLKDERATLSETLGRSLRVALPLIGLALVSGFLIMLGLVVILVPGIILITMWMVAVPAMVEEGTGIVASLGRSQRLTSGSRWRLFLMLLVLTIGFYVAIFAASALFGTFNAFSSGGAAAVSGSISGQGAGAIVITLLQAAYVILISALVASAYVELRYLHDGVQGSDIAAIFD